MTPPSAPSPSPDPTPGARFQPFDPLPQNEPAAAAARVRDWPNYFARVEGGGPRDTLLDALSRFEAEAPSESGTTDNTPLAVDLGCGSGRDTIELLARGWRVHAIDGHPEALARLLYRKDLPRTDRLTLQLAPFEALNHIPRCSLLNASFALPFCPPDRFDTLWAAIRRAIPPGGRFAGQLFGDRDSWASIPDRTHASRERALAMLDGWTLERFDEDEKEGKDASDHPKHWHVFHIVARNPD